MMMMMMIIDDDDDYYADLGRMLGAFQGALQIPFRYMYARMLSAFWTHFGYIVRRILRRI